MSCTVRDVETYQRKLLLSCRRQHPSGPPLSPPPPTPILAHSSLIIDIIKTLPFFIVAEHYDYQISTN